MERIPCPPTPDNMMSVFMNVECFELRV